ncbi:hypothetical protein [Sphingosinicella soli]|uniref:Uncharacterized protein n=1 Tax=Sphingosinicella soli TaxID=333708 RepID=A0A7W7B3H7_9SPHN|nr:hypothetical protein [Sphingosinicella soli]MBB4632370.1 hypothetical protein [Sphingosinicella soli]
MPSDFKRILLAAALAAAAFNVTAPAGRAADTPGDHALEQPIETEHRPRRIRIERCGAGEIQFGNLLEI